MIDYATVSMARKFHLNSCFGFNLNKTPNCLATHLVSRCSHSTYLELTPSLSLARALRKTTRALAHAHTKGVSYRAAVCVKCCFYIAAIFHFGLVSLNCLWGFVWGEEPSHLYMRLKGKKERWETCLCSFSFSLPPSYLSVCCPFFSYYVPSRCSSLSCYLNTSLSFRVRLFLSLSLSLSLSRLCCARWVHSNCCEGSQLNW